MIPAPSLRGLLWEATESELVWVGADASMVCFVRKIQHSGRGIEGWIL